MKILAGVLAVLMSTTALAARPTAHQSQCSLDRLLALDEFVLPIEVLEFPEPDRTISESRHLGEPRIQTSVAGLNGKNTNEFAFVFNQSTSCNLLNCSIQF